LGRSCTRTILHLAAVLLLSAGTLSAQRSPEVTAVDTASVADQAEPLYSPRGAFFRSLLLPGWGQVYVDAPGRGAVYFALASTSLWMSYVSRRQLADAREQQAFLRDTGQLEPTDETGLYEARAQQFEDWAALSIFLFFFAGADAYVSAYLADFDERVGVQAGAEGSLQFRASVPVGSPR
jgi:hypothetical protein